MGQIVWFYVENGERQGPVAEEQLRELLSRNVLPSNTLIWSPDFRDWVPASSVTAFDNVLQAPALQPQLVSAAQPQGMETSSAGSAPIQTSAEPAVDGQVHCGTSSEAQFRTLIKNNTNSALLDKDPTPVRLKAGLPDEAAANNNSVEVPATESEPEARTTEKTVYTNPELFFGCYLKNAYRVLGLTGAATQPDVKKILATIRRQAKIGKKYTSASDMAFLGPVSRTERDLLEAETALLNPQSRLKQRVLWFHCPLEWLPKDLTPQTAAGQAEQWSTCIEPAALHDAALLMQIAAIADSPDCKRPEYWKRANQLWQALVKHDSYWQYLADLDTQLGFEPIYIASDIAEIRENFMAIVTEPVMLIAKDALNTGASEIFARTGELVNNSGAGTTENSQQALIDELHRRMDSAQDELGDLLVSINRDEETYSDDIEKNADICRRAEEFYNLKVEPILDNARSVLQQTDPVLSQLRESAANCLDGIAGGYSWADDIDNATRVLNRAKPLAAGTATEPKLREHGYQIEDAKRNRKAGEILKDVKPISGAPVLFTFNTIGFHIYAALNEEPDPILGSKRAIYYLVVLFLPILPLASYRVIFEPTGGYKFLGSCPLDRAARIHQVCVLFLALAIMLSVMTAGHKGTAIQTNQAAVPQSYYQKAAELNNEAVTAMKDSDLRKSINLLKRALSYEPGYEYATDNLSIAFNNYGLKLPRERAIPFFRKALELSPSNKTTETNLNSALKGFNQDLIKSTPEDEQLLYVAPSWLKPKVKHQKIANSDIDFGPYMAALQRKIKKHWFPPKGAESKHVIVRFSVGEKGELSDLELYKSSKLATADQAALRAVSDAAPYAALPAGSPSKVSIEFTFDYNVFIGSKKK